ncbi:MAG: class I SAM-dependent methyltransferase, partial [bacterium]|nr:class I SAM-dependent methyltransferase [bacterium]
MVFEKTYSNQYDRFYLDKDYASECDLVEAVFEKFATKPRTLLDLGCGTGSHALLLAERGYRVTGVDRSPHMLETAREKAGEKNLEINFIQHDISALTQEHPDLDTPVDAVISMFAVIGYLTGNAQLAETFANIRRFLTPGGVFIFDCWYGPAVVSQRPETRVHTYDIADDHRV